MTEKDAIVCDVPSTHPASEKFTLEKITPIEKISCDQFYQMILDSKSKGNLLFAFDQYMRFGDRRGYINLNERPEVKEKLEKYSIPLK